MTPATQLQNTATTGHTSVTPAAARAAAALDFDHVITDRFAGQRGWFCLGYIDGDPRAEIREPMHQEWYFLPRQRQQIADRYAELAERGFNLYWPACLFSAKKRNYKNALPSPWIWQDDASADVRCSQLIQTSEHGYQALIQLDRPATAEERQRLQEAWRDRSSADACSKDAVHMGRMPGGWNCKNHGRFLVRIASTSDLMISVDRHLARLPKSEPKAAGEITDLAWPEVEAHLANIQQLLASGRAKTIKPDTQTGRILAGERVAIASAKLGRMDESGSMQGAILAYGFYCRGFMDDEIGAVIFHFYREWGIETRKGTQWCKADIGRCIALAHEKKPDVVQSPTRYKQAAAAAPILDQPAASRARHDRPRRLDPYMLFARYKEQPGLCELSRKPRATALGISAPTLDRLEDTLKSMGMIAIEQPGRGHAGRVKMLVGVINIPAAAVSSHQNVESAVPSVLIEQTAESVPQCIEGETHRPPEHPQPTAAAESTPAPARLADLVREAFDQVQLDRETGEKRKATRKRLLIAIGPITRSDAAIDRAIVNERQRRRIAAIVADIRGMRPPMLRQQIRLMERLADKSREQGTSLHRFADWAAGEMRGELASRPAEPGRKPRKNCEVLPDPRAAGQRYQTELLNLVEDARATTPRPAPIAVAAHLVEPSSPGSIGAVVFPPTPPAAAGPAPMVYHVPSLIERLKARQALL